MCGGGGGGGGGGKALFYCTTEAASLIKVVIFCWDIRGNYETKSTVAECVKRICLGCVDEIFSSLPGVGRRDSGGAIDSTHTRYLA